MTVDEIKELIKNLKSESSYFNMIPITYLENLLENLESNEGMQPPK